MFHMDAKAQQHMHVWGSSLHGTEVVECWRAMRRPQSETSAISIGMGQSVEGAEIVGGAQLQAIAVQTRFVLI
jgi:hypothetical protein